MKSITIKLITILITISMLSCSKSEDSDTQRDIIGSWVLSSSLFDIGNGMPEWNDVENGHTFSFKLDSTFTSSKFTDCSTGVFSLEGGQLTLDYDCDSLLVAGEFVESILIEKIDFDGGNIILQPTYINCVEECGFRYEKN